MDGFSVPGSDEIRRRFTKEDADKHNKLISDLAILQEKLQLAKNIF